MNIFYIKSDALCTHGLTYSGDRIVESFDQCGSHIHSSNRFITVEHILSRKNAMLSMEFSPSPSHRQPSLY
jgi:hypothetical protein